MELAPLRVVWPVDEATGELLDLAWLDLGTAKPVTAAEDDLIEAARRSDHPEDVLYANGVRSEARTEYDRRVAMARFGRNFLHQPRDVLAAGDVRGLFYLEWAMHIDQMKREARLQAALDLAMQTVAAADAVTALRGGNWGASGWYLKAALVLRKMGDHETELDLLRTGLQKHPDDVRLQDQLRRSLARRRG